MNKLRLFLENFLVYGLGGIVSRIIPLFMVPIVTRLMPNSTYYGLSDMSQTIVSLASAIAVMGMYDAMYRMFFEKDSIQFKETVCSTTVLFTFGTSIVVFIAMLLGRNWIASFFFKDTQYTFLVYLTAISTLVGATNTIISAPTRMQNKRKVFLVTNTVSPLISYAISIPLLLKGYYVIALPLAACVSSLTLEIAFGIMNWKWFKVKLFDADLLKDLLKIAIPLTPNFLIYWIFNSSDRVMITRLIGLGESGVYSVGAKLGMASQLIYTAFAGGWQFFAFSTMKEDNQVRSNSRIFEYLGCISFIATLCICVIAKPFYYIMFPAEYHRAFIISPYLFLAPLLQMLFQVIGNQFLVIKKTWPVMIILTAGALLNIVGNFILIPTIGIEGASIASMLGYLISVVICAGVLIRLKLLILSSRFVMVVLIFTACMLLWRFVTLNNIWLTLAVAIGFLFVIILTYRRDLKLILPNKNA